MHFSKFYQGGDIRRFYIILCTFLYVLGLSTNTLGVSAKSKKSHKRFKAGKSVKVKGAKRKYKSVYDNKLKRTRVIGDKIIVKFKKNFRKSDIQRFALENNLNQEGKVGKRTFVFSAYDSETLVGTLNHLEEDTEDKARSLVAKADIDEYKHLEVNEVKRKRSKKRVSKIPFSNHWHLKNNGGDSVSRAGADINIESAWVHTKGKGVVVAVIDTGFDIGHKDINYLNKGYSTVTQTFNAKAPFYSNENHGTAVAGIIAGKDNGKGIVGVAPEAKIVPIRLISDGGMVSTSQIIEAHLKAVELGAQIINNSWGSFDSALGSLDILELSDLEEDLYRGLAYYANGGKGVTVIFASGNSGRSNLRGHPEARSEYTLAVGAINSQDRKARYSAYGNELDLVAPGGESKGIATTDRRDKKRSRVALGYAQGSYTDTFTGTSAAAPMIAGVAALMLSVNPDLTAEQVKGILRESARHDLEGYYKFNEDGKCKELGYGIVDAAAAVGMAKNWP